MELKWLEDFLSVCDTGNFRLASKRRFVSQPAFSRRIKTLELWLGAELIDRSTQPVKLTSAGELFKPVALEIVQLAYQSRNEVKTQIRVAEHKLRFSTVSTLAQFFLPRWLKGTQTCLEINSFDIRTDYERFDDYLDALEKGRDDFFICYEDPTGIVYHYTEKFQSLCLGTEKLIPVVSTDNEGKPLYWLPDCSAGSRIPYLHTHSKPSLWPIKHHLETRYSHLNFVSVSETSIATALKAMAIEGYGVAWIPESVVADDLANGKLVRASAECDDILLDIKIYRYQKNAEPKTEKLWQSLLQHTT